jgi:hypothetical protein
MVAADLLDMAVLRLTLAPSITRRWGRSTAGPFHHLTNQTRHGLAEDHDMIAAQEVDHGKRIQDERGASKIGA